MTRKHFEALAELTRPRALVAELTAALDWIICYVDEHPEWDFAYFREGGECHAESDWYDASTATLAKAQEMARDWDRESEETK